MDHFTPMSLATATQMPNGFGMFVGIVTLPFYPGRMQAQCFYSPGTMRPCVYWRVIVQEEWISWSRDSEGRWQRSLDWRTIVDRENYTDFYLQDGDTKLYVNGSKRGDIRVQSDWDGGGRSWNTFGIANLPPSIRWLAVTHGSNFPGWNRRWYVSGHSTMPTGNFRWSEAKFEVGEKLSCLGVVSPAYQDPYVNATAMALIPVGYNSIRQEDMALWDNWDQWSWVDLNAGDPDGTVLLSDDKEYTHSIQVAPPVNLPNWQTSFVPQYAAWNPPQQQAMVQPPQQQVMVQAPQQPF